METVCSRCQKPLASEDCYCAACGLPQLVFPTEDTPDQPYAEPWNQAVRDAGSIEWKIALRAALLVAVPAGMLSSGASVLGGFAIFWMSAAAACSVILYIRNQQPAWITAGAGARIGLVTGLIAAWVTFATTGGTLFVQRFFLHQSVNIDNEWKTRVEMGQQLATQITSSMTPAYATQTQAAQQAQYLGWMLSPEVHAGMEALRFAVNAGFLLFFAMLGGILGARMLARRRPNV
jgi:hypothetical protein